MNFKRGIDPKEALEIGLFSNREFNTLKEAREWVVRNHVAILGLDGLCIFSPSQTQYSQLREYIEKYISATYEIGPEYILDGVVNLYRELAYVARQNSGNK
jgi:hypothetical protein